MYNMSKNIGTITTHFTGAPNSKAITDIVGRMKKAMRAAVLATVALVAIPVSAPIAKAAADKAKKDAMDAAKGGK